MKRSNVLIAVDNYIAKEVAEYLDYISVYLRIDKSGYTYFEIKNIKWNPAQDRIRDFIQYIETQDEDKYCIIIDNLDSESLKIKGEPFRFNIDIKQSYSYDGLFER